MPDPSVQPPEGLRTSDVEINPHSQQAMAATREAVGQCLVCGAFRLDGKPPTAHRTGCSGQGPYPENQEDGD